MQKNHFEFNKKDLRKYWLYMRLVSYLLIFSFLQVSAHSYGQKINLNEKNKTLLEVFSKIRQQSNYDFIFTGSAIKGIGKINIVAKEEDIQTVIEKIFMDLPIDFKFEGTSVILTRNEHKLKAASKVEVKESIQKMNISGRIVDPNGNSLHGATVKVMNHPISTITDQNGHFVIENAPENVSIEISFVGYVTRRVKAHAAMGVIVLQLESNELGEVVLNAGYYSVRDKEKTGNITKISSEVIERQPIINPITALQGRVAGLDIAETGGMIGNAVKVNLRGINSIAGGTSPLYIIDGIPFSDESLGDYNVSRSLANGSFALLSTMNSINGADIESIEVLKDADATAIYGSRGANGVILITTKKGKKGKTRFEYNMNAGFNKPTMGEKVLNTEQYIRMRKDAYAEDGITTYPAVAYDVNGTWDTTRYTDFYKELVGRSAGRMSTQLSISGGNEHTQFLLSGTFLKQSPSFPQQYKFRYQKTSVNTHLNHSSEDKRFNVQLSLNYSLDDNNMPGEDPHGKIISRAPNSPKIFNEDGSLHWENGFNNPFAIFNSSYSSKTKTMNSVLNVQYKIANDLVISSRMGYNEYVLSEYHARPHTINAPTATMSSLNSSAYDNNGKRISWIVEPQLNWKKKFNLSTIDILIGTSFQKTESEKKSAAGSSFSSNALIHNIYAATNFLILSSNHTLYKYNAVYGRINYNYDGRYLLNLTARRDGSSRFGPGNQFANFGAIGAAWIFTNEKFLENLTFLSFGKLRGSYGLTGNDQIGDYQFLNSYSLSGQYGGANGMIPTKHYNPNFSWETNKKLEFALELGFIKDKILLTTSFYRNRSSNQLVGLPIPAMTGFATVQSNFDAVIQNQGIEIELNTVNIETKNFSWKTAFNYSKPNNKLVSYPGLEYSVYANTYRIGRPLNLVRTYTYTGIDPITGLYTFEDVNKDGVLTLSDDRNQHIHVGLKYSAGMNNTISYKGFQLDVFFQYVNKTERNYYYNRGATGGMMTNVNVDLLDNWTYNKDNPKHQRLTTGGNAQAMTANTNMGYSDASISNASFLRLKNVQLSYRIPKKLIGLEGDIYAQGQNLATFTKYPGADPENALSSYMAPLKIWNFGLRFNF